MDIRRYSFICTLVLMSLPWSEAGCKEDLINDFKFMACSMQIVGYMMNASQSTSEQITATSDEGSKQTNLICSPEGKAAFGCIREYIVKCPDLMQQENGSNPLSSLQQISGFDGTALLSEDIETICALLVGPCKEVTNCFSENTIDGEIVKRGAAPDSINYYQQFITWSLQLCGEGKALMECMITTLDRCPASITNWLESKFEQGVRDATPDEYEVVSYRDTKNFFLNECPKMPDDLGADMCIENILMSPDFSDCNYEAYMKYSQDKSCMVHNLSKPCIEEQLKPCGDDTASFFARNTHIIFAGIPSNCEMTQELTLASMTPKLTSASMTPKLTSASMTAELNSASMTAELTSASMTAQLTSANNAIAVPFQLLLLLSFLSVISVD